MKTTEKSKIWVHLAVVSQLKHYKCEGDEGTEVKTKTQLVGEHKKQHFGKEI